MRQLTSANGVVTEAVRYGLPAVLILSGVVVLLVADDSSRYDGFALLVGSGLSVSLFNLLFRLGASGDRTRDDEERAREFFSGHGYGRTRTPTVEPH